MLFRCECIESIVHDYHEINHAYLFTLKHLTRCWLTLVLQVSRSDRGEGVWARHVMSVVTRSAARRRSLSWNTHSCQSKCLGLWTSAPPPCDSPSLLVFICVFTGVTLVGSWAPNVSLVMKPFPAGEEELLPLPWCDWARELRTLGLRTGGKRENSLSGGTWGRTIKVSPGHLRLQTLSSTTMWPLTSWLLHVGYKRINRCFLGSLRGVDTRIPWNAPTSQLRSLSNL